MISLEMKKLPQVVGCIIVEAGDRSAKILLNLKVLI